MWPLTLFSDAQDSIRESSTGYVLTIFQSSFFQNSTNCVSRHIHWSASLVLCILSISDAWVLGDTSNYFSLCSRRLKPFSPSTSQIHNITLWFEILYDGSKGGLGSLPPVLPQPFPWNGNWVPQDSHHESPLIWSDQKKFPLKMISKLIIIQNLP